MPARYDLSQIPYEYAVEVTNRFKGLDLVNSMPEELQMDIHNTVQEAVNKAIPKKMKSKKAKGLSPESFKYLKKEEKQKPREKGKSASNLRQHSKEEHPETRRPSSMNSA